MKLPKSLFKYINLSQSVEKVNRIINSIFVESKLKITTSRHFNDRFDSKVIFNQSIREQILNAVDKIVPGNHTLTEERIRFFELMLEAQPILCLSEIPPLEFESDIMWGVYGGNGCGICLEFDFDEISIINQNTLNFGSTFKVAYDDTVDKYELFYHAILSKMRSEVLIYNGMPYHDATKDFADAMKALHMRKGSQWSHEKEYRLIDSFYLYNINVASDAERLRQVEDLAQRDDYFIPITKEPKTFELPPVLGATRTTFFEMHLPVPKKIYLGFLHSYKKTIAISDDNLAKIYNFAKKYDIAIYQLTGEVNYLSKTFDSTRSLFWK